jgi:hypothetical protein
MQRPGEELKLKFRWALYNCGPVAVSRLRKALAEADGHKMRSVSFTALYRRLCRFIREADAGKLARLNDAVAASTVLDDADQRASRVCVHEIAHTAIPYHFNFGLHSHPVKAALEGTGVFEYRDNDWSVPLNIGMLGATTGEARQLCLSRCERILMCSLAGLVAEDILDGEEGLIFVIGQPLLIGRLQSDPRDDLLKVRELVRAIRGNDDSDYQFQIQQRCAGILMHPRMWEGIIVAASLLYERKEMMDGAEVESIFESLKAPQFYPR